MRKLLNQTVPLLMHFEHATVIVVGSQFLAEHFTNLITVGAAVIVFLIFQLVKGAT